MSIYGSGTSVAVVGAGFAGLTAARRLSDGGGRVKVFDTGRGPGGRMSTRHQDGREFDHGAQFFTVREDTFRGAVDDWLGKGLVARWGGSVVKLAGGAVESSDPSVPRYVGVPRMSSVCRSMSDTLTVEYGTAVARVAREGGSWELRSADGRQLGLFDRVIVTTPPAQAAPLLAQAREIAAQVSAVEMLPCWAVMVSFGNRLEIDWDGAFVADSPLTWAARNSSKPGRPAMESWVWHGSPEWSSDHIEYEAEHVGELLLEEFFQATGCAAVGPLSTSVHRWRYARARNPLGVGFLCDAELGVGVCGDWCRGDRLEDAFMSGFLLAQRMGTGG